MPPIENVGHQQGSADDDAHAHTEQKDEDLLESTLMALPTLLKKRQKDLVERERALEEAVAAFQKEKTTVCGDASPSDVLHLNVGGTKIQVLRRTLTSVPGSMLTSKFSGRWDESMERDRDGNLFIDQPFPVFELMVTYLRAKACQTPNAPPLKSPNFNNSTVRKEDFLRMLEYYGMVLGIHPVKIELYSKISNKVEYGGDLGITNSSDCWASFGIVAQGHSMVIKSFEVTIRQVERAQIGWRNSSYVETSEIAGGTHGIGEIPSTVALDCCRSVMLLNGALIPIDGRCKDGSTIRCEDGGNKWYVDGRLVASTDQADNVTLIEWNVTGVVEVPAISVKGSFCVSDVEYRLH
jgi:hypothetical protein